MKEIKAKNKGYATVELSIIMLVYMTVIIMCFQSFFLLLAGAENYKNTVIQETDCSIEETMKSMRRWQFID